MFFFGAFAMYLYGGLLNTEFKGKYEEITGDEIDDDFLIFNFNDITNSFLYFFNINLSGDYFTAVNTAVVL